MGIDILLRDLNGLELACLSSSRSFHSKPVLVECWALWRTIVMRSWDFSVQLEGDALVVIQCIGMHDDKH